MLSAKDKYTPVEYVPASAWQTLNAWVPAATQAENEEGVENEELSKDLVMIRTVVNSTVKLVYELDNNKPIMKLAPHRNENKFSVGSLYPAHAVIVVSDVDTANDVAAYMNKMFKQDRDRFPVRGGWRAEVAHSKGDHKFNRKHPFFYYKRFGKMNSKAARFVVVVDLAQEGMNNKYLNVMGLAKNTDSDREQVQRIGRLIRSAADISDSENMIAPPMMHDSIHIVTHNDYSKTRDTLNAALAYLHDMVGATQGLLTIEEYANEDVDFSDLDDLYIPKLTYDDEMTLSLYVGECIHIGRRVSVKKALKLINSGKKGKRELVRRVVKDLHENNNGRREGVAKDLFQVSLPEPMDPVATNDRVALEDLDEVGALVWLENNPEFSEMIGHFDSPNWLPSVNQVYKAFDTKHFRSQQIELSQTVEGLLNAMAHRILKALKLPRVKIDLVRQLVEEAALTHLSNMGATSLDIEEGGRLDIPSVVQQLRNGYWQGSVKSWVAWNMYKTGHMPNLEPLFKTIV